MTINWTSKIVGLIAAINTALIAFGAYHMNDNQLQAITTLISVVVMVAGVWLPHLKDAGQNGSDGGQTKPGSDSKNGV